MTTTIEDRVHQAVDGIAWPARKAIAPNGHTIETQSLATIRDLAAHLGMSENTVRLAVRRLADAGLVQVYQLRDVDAGVRRLYVTTAEYTDRGEVNLTVGEFMGEFIDRALIGGLR